MIFKYKNTYIKHNFVLLILFHKPMKEISNLAFTLVWFITEVKVWNRKKNYEERKIMITRVSRLWIIGGGGYVLGGYGGGFNII